MNNDIMSVEQAAATLNVTAATIKNWKRTRRLSDAEGGVFSREIEALCEAGVLTSRRNKSSLRCSRTDTGYIVGHDKLKKLLDGPMCRDEIRAILAEAALRLFLKGENLLDGFLKGTVTVSDSDRLIADLASGAVIDRNNAHILSAPWEADKGQDVLGFVYSSLLPLDQRRAAGAYYTPLSVAAAAVSKPELKGSILDPCCGSGSFLIAAAQAGADMEELFGIDMDPTAVCLARINLRCRFPELSLDYLYKHIQCLDFFDISTKYSCVIGNPPWGGKPEMSERFILHAMELLNSNGSFSLLIPQALLSVRLHSHLREKMLETLSFLSVDYMGNCFKGVYCPSVILAAKKSENPGLKGCRVNSSFVINSDREIDPRCLNLLVTDEEYRRLQKMKSIKHAAFLKGSAIFGLGIVTGSNSRCLSRDCGTPIIRGTDIEPFLIREPSCFLLPDAVCQQTARPEIYSAPAKIVYRFIGRRPIFAVDRLGRLTLNSCNIIIPQIERLDIDYITAILNSPAAEFFLTKSFDTEKWLRWHLEELPLPVISPEEQSRIIKSPDRDKLIDELYFG